VQVVVEEVMQLVDFVIVWDMVVEIVGNMIVVSIVEVMV
jgi:hypothetical protein